MEKDFINNVALNLRQSGNTELASKWVRLAQEMGFGEEAINPMTGYEPNPMISNFARPSSPEAKTNEHTCSVTFSAPDNITEDKMMEYITNIKTALPGVVVGGFKWSVKAKK
jgi:hypothetical protein